MKIYIVGFMGAGKTTVGKLLAYVLGYTFFDIDEYIEKYEGMTISQIFAQKGEDYFRNLEDQKLRELSIQDNIVVATGGGLGAKLENMEFMKAQGSVVWLDVDINKVFERCKGDDSRPLLKRGYNFIQDLYEKRKKVYKLADVKICVNNNEPDYIVKEILDILFA